MVFAGFRPRLPLTVSALDNVFGEFVFFGAIEQALCFIVRIHDRLVVLAHVAGGAAQHQIFVLVAFAAVEFAIEMVDVRLAWMPKFAGIETVRAAAFEIFEQVGKGLLPIRCLSEFGLRSGAALDSRLIHQMETGRKNC
jgi:hypothetical protein